MEHGGVLVSGRLELMLVFVTERMEDERLLENLELGWLLRTTLCSSILKELSLDSLLSFVLVF